MKTNDTSQPKLVSFQVWRCLTTQDYTQEWWEAFSALIRYCWAIVRKEELFLPVESWETAQATLGRLINPYTHQPYSVGSILDPEINRDVTLLLFKKARQKVKSVERPMFDTIVEGIVAFLNQFHGLTPEDVAKAAALGKFRSIGQAVKRDVYDEIEKRNAAFRTVYYCRRCRVREPWTFPWVSDKTRASCMHCIALGLTIEEAELVRSKPITVYPDAPKLDEDGEQTDGWDETTAEVLKRSASR